MTTKQEQLQASVKKIVEKIIKEVDDLRGSIWCQECLRQHPDGKYVRDWPCRSCRKQVHFVDETFWDLGIVATFLAYSIDPDAAPDLDDYYGPVPEVDYEPYLDDDADDVAVGAEAR